MVEATPPTTFKERRIDAGGRSVNCREAGSGLPVVILESISWDQSELYSALARQFQVFILELPDTDPTSNSTADVAAIGPILGQIVTGAYTLIGTSWSANVALRLARQDGEKEDREQAERIEALILISPTALRPADDLAALAPEQFAERLLAHPEQFPDLDGLTKELAVSQTARNSWATVRASEAAEVESSLEEVRCPTLVVFGSRDRLVASEAAAIYRGRIPNCNVSLIYDAGHLVAAERPEALTNAVADFVENWETFVVTRKSSVINP